MCGDAWTDGSINGWVAGLIHGQTTRQMEGFHDQWTIMNEWEHGQTDRQVDG